MDNYFSIPQPDRFVRGCFECPYMFPRYGCLICRKSDRNDLVVCVENMQRVTITCPMFNEKIEGCNES